ncbi:hypothetical protein B0H14DRAFT_3733558 [Mycena olivaceomarginata]|nr:hypothetical protein B0H14DRAFT_3733558 [Mycena olivaceomarginata]
MRDVQVDDDSSPNRTGFLLYGMREYKMETENRCGPSLRVLLLTVFQREVTAFRPPPKPRVPASGVSTRIFLDINQSRTKEFLNFFPRKDKYLITPARRVIPPGATGSFTESIPRLLGSAEHGKVVIVVGKGEAPVSFTAVPDIAGPYFPTRRMICLLSATPFITRSSIPPSKTRLPFGSHTAFLPPSYRTIFSDSKAKGQVRTILACSSMLKLLDSRVRSTGWDAENQREKTGSDGAGSANPLWAGHSWKRIREVLNL